MDVVVTVPKGIWLDWLAEGDCVGDPPTGEGWRFCTWGCTPDSQPGDRVYIVAHGRLRGYSPLVRLGCSQHGPPREYGQGRVCFVRGAGAVAVTIPRPITGFRGWRYRDWERADEIPFPAWRTEGVRA